MNTTQMNGRAILGLFLASAFLNIEHVNCWSFPPSTSTTSQPKATSTTPSRRDILSSLIATPAAILLTNAPTTPAALAATVPTAQDLRRIQSGHARVQYLLQNWNAITETCGNGVMSDIERKQVVRTDGGGGGVCELNPLAVQDYLGYKSTLDPLFKVDKLMLKAAPLVDPDEFENYLSVVESYTEKADMGSMMAYTSSWGEANPNGGKDIMEEYLERTKDEVVATEVLLRKVLGYLNLEVLPPSKKG